MEELFHLKLDKTVSIHEPNVCKEHTVTHKVRFSDHIVFYSDSIREAVSIGVYIVKIYFFSPFFFCSPFLLFILLIRELKGKCINLKSEF
jgi:hypothetical protein